MREAVLYEIFLDLQNAYDVLDPERCIEIISVYAMDPR